MWHNMLSYLFWSAEENHYTIFHRLYNAWILSSFKAIFQVCIFSEWNTKVNTEGFSDKTQMETTYWVTREMKIIIGTSGYLMMEPRRGIYKYLQFPTISNYVQTYNLQKLLSDKIKKIVNMSSSYMFMHESN